MCITHSIYNPNLLVLALREVIDVISSLSS